MTLAIRTAAVVVGVAALAGCTHGPTELPKAAGRSSPVFEGLGSPGCRSLPAAVANHRPVPRESHLTTTLHILNDITVRPAPRGFRPGVSAAVAYQRSGLDRQPGARLQVFLASLSAPLPSRHGHREFHGQVFWVVRAIKTAHPYQGLPRPITSDDRQCAGLAPPSAVLTASSAKELIEGN